jgi:hypothetical protein
MSTQNTQTISHKIVVTIERAADQLGMLLLLALGVTTAGATILVGV